MFFLIGIIIFLFSVILHEFAHGAMAERLGDPTARSAGRLTLNPLPHLDPIGSVLLPLMLVLFQSNIIIGWAKPVPVNLFNLRNRKYASAEVAIAGPAANIALALFFGLLLRFLPLPASAFGQNLTMVFGYIVWINLLLALFNLTPIPPFDGAHILFTFLPRTLDNVKIFLSRYGLFIVIFYIFFLFPFLIPIVQFFFNLIVGIPFA